MYEEGGELMIFISHNSKDKDFIGPIAKDFRNAYGEENVFFDSWSIKPGENIISEMSEGLEKCEFFFFFITENSLKSEMVKLEWTSALKEKSNRNINFIPIKADDVNVPMIISSLNYLDMFSNGYDVVFTQMKEIVENAYKEIEYPTFNNLKAYALSRTPDKVSLFVIAKRFFEPSSTFLVATNLNDEQVKVKIENASMYNSAFNSDSGTFKGRSMNTFTIGVQGGVKKGFKIEITVERIKGELDFLDLHHVKGEDDFPRIPIEIVNKITEIEM